MRLKYSIFILLFFFLQACDNPFSSKDAVNWNNYSITAKIQIDSATQQKRCDLLQNMLNLSYNNDLRQRAKTGIGNFAIASYIEKKMREAACY